MLTTISYAGKQQQMPCQNTAENNELLPSHQYSAHQPYSPINYSSNTAQSAAVKAKIPHSSDISADYCELPAHRTVQKKSHYPPANHHAIHLQKCPVSRS